VMTVGGIARRSEWRAQTKKLKRDAVKSDLITLQVREFRIPAK
jgi:hypothetical protein